MTATEAAYVRHVAGRVGTSLNDALTGLIRRAARTDPTWNPEPPPAPAPPAAPARPRRGKQQAYPTLTSWSDAIARGEKGHVPGQSEIPTEGEDQ